MEMHCERCGASMDPSHCFPGAKLTCTCGAVNVVRVPKDAPPVVDLRSHQTAPHAEGPAPCPRCGHALHPQAAHGEEVLSCDGCSGCFVGHPALARLTEAAHADTSRRDGTSTPPRFEREVHYAKCPRCAQLMSRVNYGHRSGVLVDSCRIHGTWFDAGELDAVLAFVARGGLEEHVEPEKNEVVAKAALQMQSALAVERLHDVARVEEATDFVSDLLWFILPGDRYSDFRRRRW